MSTAPSTQPRPTSPPATEPPREVIIYGHTALFYWWPVWVLGYIFAIATWIHDTRVAIVPANSDYRREVKIDGKVQQPGTIILPEGSGVLSKVEEHNGKTVPVERIHDSKNLGVIFSIVLFLVVMITNVPLRGLSSAIVVSLILLLTVFFAYMDWWESIFHALGQLAIHMNMGFYVFFSTLLFIAWAGVTFIHDRMSYWHITKDQITHEYVVGGGQKSYNTEGMAFEKLRDDMFRHWVLGGGSGDLIMYPMQSAGASREELQIHNVLFVGKKLAMIQELIASKPI